MKKTVILFSALALLLAAACQPSTNPEHQAEDKLNDEIIALHDEVMPKMGELNRLERELKKAAEKLPSTDTYNQDNIAQTLRLLQKADDAMGRWMEQYEPPSKKRGELTHEYIMMYLGREKEKMETVKTMMNESMGNARDILAGLGKTE